MIFRRHIHLVGQDIHGLPVQLYQVFQLEVVGSGVSFGFSWIVVRGHARVVRLGFPLRRFAQRRLRPLIYGADVAV